MDFQLKATASLDFQVAVNLGDAAPLTWKTDITRNCSIESGKNIFDIFYLLDDSTC